MSQSPACAQAAPPSSPFTTPQIPGLFYYRDFVSPYLATSLHTAILSHPHAWKTLTNRTLQNWGGLPHIKGMIPTPLPTFLTPLISLLVSTSLFPSSHPPNHVLVNRYLPGQGIHPHVDGPAYKPRAAIVSLLSPIVMDFYSTSHNPTPAISPSQCPAASLLLEPNSCLLLTSQAYTHFYHAIAERTRDTLDSPILNLPPTHPPSYPRHDRISLTLRTSCRTIRNPLLTPTRLAKPHPPS